MATASDYLVQRLYDWGVRRVYGYPGDGINGVMGALNREQEKVSFIQTRHEEEAAFMACAHAKFTGEVGVCIATSGPGAIHLLNGLYDAKLDHQPVVAIVGQQATTVMGADYQQEVDLLSLFKDVAHHYVHMATSAAQVRQLVDRAIRIALAERTVTCVILPSDIQEEDEVAAPVRKHGSTFTGLGFHGRRCSRHATSCSGRRQSLTRERRWRCWSVPVPSVPGRRSPSRRRNWVPVSPRHSSARRSSRTISLT